MSKPKLLAFAGSTRKDSWNKKLARAAARAARDAGAEVTELDLRDLPLPLYDGDLEAEQGLPENALKLKDLFKGHQGFLLASPEYNSSISGVLKNAIDWASRPREGEPPLAAFTGKVFSLLAASPGALGGLRGLVTVRSILSNINAIVLPDQLCVGKAHEAFGEDGKLKDPKLQAWLEKLAANTTRVVEKLSA